MAEASEIRTTRRAVILTTATEEYRAVRAHLRDLREEIDPSGSIYEIGVFEGASGLWDVAIAEVGIGNVTAAMGTELAVLRYRPNVLLLVSIAEGNNDEVNPGDVVVPERVLESKPVSFSLGRSRGGALNDASALHPTYRLLQRARAEARYAAWWEQLKRKEAHAPPQVRFGTVLSGEVSGITLDALRRRNALSIDAEAYRVLSALHDHAQIDALIVQGIATVIEDDKPARARKMAAQHSSAFAFEILGQLKDSAPGKTHQRAAVSEPLEKLYLSHIQITDLRALAECDWQIDVAEGPGWHVLLGDNGAGKSTMLRAIALALFEARETEALRQNWATWLRNGHPRGRANATLTHADQLLHRQRTIEFKLIAPSPVTHTGATPIVTHDGTGRDAPAPVFSAGYGPFRRFSGGDLEYEKEIEAYPRLLRHLSLFSERAALTESLGWLKDLRFKQLEGHPDGDLLGAVRAFINESNLLPLGVQLTDVSSEAVTFVDGNDCRVPIEELSDGFRSVLSLTLDLLRHMASAFGASGVFSPVDPLRIVASGIVLIDEVDVHLHPRWQHRIGDWFRAHFPAIQFIVATHSPLICQAADTVFLLPTPGSADPGRRLVGTELDRLRYGNVLDAFSTGVFGLDITRSEESKRLLQRLAELNTKELDEELSPDEQAEQSRLRAILPTGGRITGTEPPT